jgi:hypothetical protein
MTPLEAMDAELRELRVKKGVDYAYTHKYGQTRLMCCDVFMKTVTEVAEKHGVWFVDTHPYFNFLED